MSCNPFILVCCLFLHHQYCPAIIRRASRHRLYCEAREFDFHATLLLSKQLLSLPPCHARYKLLGKKTSRRTERGELCMSLSFVDEDEIKQATDMQRNAVAKCHSMQDEDLDLADWKLRVGGPRAHPHPCPFRLYASSLTPEPGTPARRWS